jgi:hypothetical protein
MIDKFVPDMETALAGIKDGAKIMMGGFGSVGQPVQLVDALADMGVRHLTLIANNAGAAFGGMTKLLQIGAIDSVICSYPRSTNSTIFIDLCRRARWPSASAPPRPGFPPFSPPPPPARNWGPARRPARSMDGSACWRRLCMPISRCWKPGRPIAGAT